MSTHALRLPRVDGANALLPIAAGLLLLLLRVQIITAGSGRNLLMAAAYVLLIAVSVSPAARECVSTAAVSTTTATLLGIVALAAVAFAPWQVRIVTPRAGAALGLGVLAAVAEEAFFRRLLFDRLSRAGVAVAVVGSAVAFALVHVPLYGTSVLWVDLGAGLLLSWQRWASGSWTAPAITHSFANLLAVIR